MPLGKLGIPSYDADLMRLPKFPALAILNSAKSDGSIRNHDKAARGRPAPETAMRTASYPGILRYGGLPGHSRELYFADPGRDGNPPA